MIGRRLDEYQIEKQIGQGGMARVYLGVDVRLKRRVAIKIIDAAYHTNTEYQARFEREAQAIARLEHPHIVRLYRYGEVDGLVYMAMQYIEGSDLSSLMADYRKSKRYIEPAKAISIIRDACLALDFAHLHGVIHRDVKPSNIILDKQGCAYLADFGLARMLDVGTQGKIFGSPHYMAPEQAISSANAVPQTDLYAVGVILYEMFTGHLPFDSDSATEIAMMHLSEPVKPPRKWRPKLSTTLEAVILKALEKEPGDRYPDGKSLADALEAALKDAPPAAQKAPDTLVSRATPTLRRKEEAPRAGRVMPPMPAAVAPAKKAEHTPSRSRRRLRWIFPVIVLLAILGVAGFMLLNRDSSDVTRQDSDGDHVVNAEDRCPDLVGTRAARGCLFTGRITANSNANLRSGPGTMYDTLGVVRPQDYVIVLASNNANDWLFVRTMRTDPANEVEAWVARALIQTEADQLPILVDPPTPTPSP
jgi:serine/threonine protein kinase